MSLGSKFLYAFRRQNKIDKDKASYLTEAGNVTGECTGCDAGAITGVFPGLDINNIADIIEKSNKTNVLDNLIKVACERNKINFQGDNIIVEHKFTLGATDRLAKALNFMDENLSNANPVSISYNSEMLYDSNTHLKFEMPPDHGSTIAGRRFNEETGECEYLIRNSWGRGCRVYDRSYTCEEGNIWVPQKILSGSISGVTAIEEKNNDNE